MLEAFTRLATFGFLIVLLACSLPPGRASGASEEKPSSPGKAAVLSAEEVFKKLKQGLLKLKEAEVLVLLGPPDRVKHPGTQGFDLQMEWKYSTHVYATFKDGELAEVTGSFSERLPVERLTLANFKRLRVGMTERDVTDLLGKSNGTANVDGVLTHSWGTSAELQVSLSKEGLLVNYALRQNSAVFLPAGVGLPGLPK
jgi:hypothetical protein